MDSHVALRSSECDSCGCCHERWKKFFVPGCKHVFISAVKLDFLTWGLMEIDRVEEIWAVSALFTWVPPYLDFLMAIFAHLDAIAVHSGATIYSLSPFPPPRYYHQRHGAWFKTSYNPATLHSPEYTQISALKPLKSFWRFLSSSVISAEHTCYAFMIKYDFTN